MIPNVNRGGSGERGRNSTLPTRWPSPGGTTTGWGSIAQIVSEKIAQGGQAAESGRAAAAVADRLRGQRGGHHAGDARVDGRRASRGEHEGHVAVEGRVH